MVVDDDRTIRALVASILCRIGLASIEAADGDEAIRAATASRPSVVILDVCVPRIGGYALCHELRELYGEELPIVFISGERTRPADRTAGLLLGADDYVLKPFDPDELLARVRRLLRRTVQRAAGPAEPAALGDLTPRETEVLDLLTEGRTEREIAGSLVISPKTVATHIQRILAKLGVHSRAQAVAYALRGAPPVPEVETSSK